MEGHLVLINAVKNDNSELAKLLIPKCDVNIQDKNGRTALHWAVRNNNLEIAKLLIDNKCDTTIKNDEGKTYLDYVLDDKIHMFLSPLECFIYQHVKNVKQNATKGGRCAICFTSYKLHKPLECCGNKQSLCLVCVSEIKNCPFCRAKWE